MSEGMFNKALTLESEGNYKAAATLYRKAIKSDGMNAAAHVNLGTILYNENRFPEALLHYRAAISIDPNFALAHFDLGNVEGELGRDEEAVLSYETALSLAPSYADAHYNLALAHEKAHRTTEALVHWRRYVALDKSGPWFIHASNQITRIMKSQPLQMVRSNDKPERTADRANLIVVKGGLHEPNVG